MPVGPVIFKLVSYRSIIFGSNLSKILAIDPKMMTIDLKMMMIDLKMMMIDPNDDDWPEFNDDWPEYDDDWLNMMLTDYQEIYRNIHWV